MLTDSEDDRTAAKLKGFNCYIKFIDGEVVYLNVSEMNDDEKSVQWLGDMEDRLNEREFKSYFPTKTIAINRAHVKYVRKI